MKDSLGRTIDSLRVSVTDRCDLRCGYCRAEDVKWLPREAILSLEELAAVVRIGVEMGIRNVRLTGGEPLLRRGLPDLVRQLAAIPGLQDLAMTTNGVHLAEHAATLVQAGLKRVNVSLDSVDSERFREITGGGDVRAVLAGIDAALAAGLKPVKLNCVVEATADEPDARGVADYARARGLELRFIQKMDRRIGKFGVVEPGGGGDCSRCSRLRLTCDGKLRPCLFSDLVFDTRALGAREAFTRALVAKPATGAACCDHKFHYIGG